MSDVNTKAGRIDAENQKVATLPRQKPQLLAGNAGHAIVPQSVEACYRMAELIVKAGMAPKSLNTVEKATVAILHGLEVGLTPMAALQSIAVINGNPSVWGDGMLALIEASGLMEDFEETIEYDDKGEPQSATCMMKRVGRRPTERTFTRPMAARAGLLKKEGPWQGYPHRMMQRRARWWCATDTFSDVLKGLGSAEERQDMVDVTAEGSATTAPTEPRRADFQARPAQDAAPAAPTWELYDEVGEMVGEFAAADWLERILGLAVAAEKMSVKHHAQLIENNAETAKAVWEDAATDEATAKQIAALYEAKTEPETGTTAVNWRVEGVTGEPAIIAKIKELIGKAPRDLDVQAILSQNADRLSKMSMMKRNDLEQAAEDRVKELAAA